MNSKKQRKVANTASEFLDNLTEFFINCDEGLSKEELKEELREEGINPEDLISRVNQFVKSKLKEVKGAWKKAAHEKRKSLLEQMSFAKYEIPKSLSELKGKIKEMLSGVYGNEIQGHAQAYFRNFEEITEEDLRSFYEDLMKLKSLEEQSKENNKGDLHGKP